MKAYAFSNIVLSCESNLTCVGNSLVEVLFSQESILYSLVIFCVTNEKLLFSFACNFSLLCGRQQHFSLTFEFRNLAVMYRGLCSTNPVWNSVNNFNLQTQVFIHTGEMFFFICLINVFPPSVPYSPSETSIIHMLCLLCLFSLTFFSPFIIFIS